MHIVTVARNINAPADRVWEALDDFGDIADYSPFLASSPITNGVERGEGAERTCHFNDGGAIVERITHYEPGRGYRVDIVDAGPFPLREARAFVQLEPLGHERVRASFRLEFKPRYGPLGWLMAQTLMKPRFASNLGQVLYGLEEHVTRGRTRESDQVPAAA